MSKPRPIHTAPRKVNDKPSPHEPSYSYEEQSFLMLDDENDKYFLAAEQFHEKNGDFSIQRSGGGNNNASNNIGGMMKHCSQSFSDIAFEMEDSDDNHQNNGDSALHRSATSCPSMANKKWAENSDLQPNDYVGSLTSKPMSRLPKPPHFVWKNNKDNEDEDYNNLAKRFARLKRSGSSSAGLDRSRRGANKRESKKRAEARMYKQGALEGSLEFGRDEMVAATATDIAMVPMASDDAFEEESTSTGIDHRSMLQYTSNIIEDLPNLKGKRLEIVQEQLSKASNQPHGKKRRLVLRDLNLTGKELPTDIICTYPLGPTLTKLCLAGNQLNYLPFRLVGSGDLDNLTTLDVQQCELASLPEEWDLPCLFKLNLSHNRLKCFLSQDALEGLPALTHLDMSNNEIDHLDLPEGDFLAQIEHLNLECNQIIEIPAEMGQMQKLEYFNISSNQISAIPSNICSLSSLRELLVIPNPLIQPPSQECESLASMKRYYEGLAKVRVFNESRAQRQKEKEERKLRRSGGEEISTTSVPAFDETAQSTGPLFGMDEESAYLDSPVLMACTDDFDSSPVPRMRGSARETIKGSEVPGNMGPNDANRLFFDDDRELGIYAPPQADTLRLSAMQPRIRIGNGRRAPMGAGRLHTTLGITNVPVSVPCGGTPIAPCLQQQSRRLWATPGPAKDPRPAVNDTLKIIFVGMKCVGKTTIIRQLVDGPKASVPKHEERTIGVDICEWEPDKQKFNTEIRREGDALNGDTTHIKFSVWDFGGQYVYHAIHEIFFSPSALYVLVWDMAACNESASRRRQVVDDIDDDWEDSSDEEEDDIYTKREEQRADRALDQDIDEKVQYWVNCIQNRVPGAAILPVCSHDDIFDGTTEARRRMTRLKERLTMHEKKRIEGLKHRLEILKNQKCADTLEAGRIRKLISPFHCPKLLFGSDGNICPKVSGQYSRGFDSLSKRIIDVATGREFADNMSYPLFRGHIGSPIPPIRLKIRQFVQQKKAEKILLLETAYLLTLLEEFLGYSPDHFQIGDALSFLNRTGEVAFFGELRGLIRDNQESSDERINSHIDREFSGLGTFVFFDQKWISSTMGCILRHDLKQQIEETKKCIEQGMKVSPRWQSFGRGGSFLDSNLNCPIITASEAQILWRARRKIVKAAERACAKSTSSDGHGQPCPFIYMQRLLIHFGVFVPIDDDNLQLHATFGGKDLSSFTDRCAGEGSDRDCFFFLPSQLDEVVDHNNSIWTYKCSDSWKTCLCQTWLFPDGSPPGLMERVTASILRDLFAVTIPPGDARTSLITKPCTDDRIGKLIFREILCWKTALNIVLGKPMIGEDGTLMESRIELWVHLADQDSTHCVAGEINTPTGTRRLIVAAKGPEGNGCRKIWDGGFNLALDAVECVIDGYPGLEFTKQALCPMCLASRDLRLANLWGWTRVQNAAKSGSRTLTCADGHRVDMRNIGGQVGLPSLAMYEETDEAPSANPKVPFSNLCDAVVLVGMWDCQTKTVVTAGSGFIVDAKQGLIVTASHILIDMESGENFGSDFFGYPQKRAVIGIIAKSNTDQKRPNRYGRQKSREGPRAEFQYFAEIVAKRPRSQDACVLRITAKFSIGIDGHSLISKPITNSGLAREKLQKLKPTKRCEYEEDVRILGYGQGGEGLFGSPPPRLNQVIEVVTGNVSKIHDTRKLYYEDRSDLNQFTPSMEIVIGNCPTLGGISGGPCVNQEGKVVGILSRVDPEDKSRCYLVPAEEFMKLVSVAKYWM